MPRFLNLWSWFTTEAIFSYWERVVCCISVSDSVFWWVNFPRKILFRFWLQLLLVIVLAFFFYFWDRVFELSSYDVLSSPFFSSFLGTIVTSVPVLRNPAFPQSRRELWQYCEHTTLSFRHLPFDWRVQDFLQLQLRATLLLVPIFAATECKVISLVGASRKSFL